MHLDEIAARQLGLFTTQQATRCGLGRSTLVDWTRSGRVARVQRSVYRVAATPDHPDHAVLAALLRAGPGAAASHRSSLYRHGLLTVDPHPVEITSPRNLAVADAVVYRRHLPQRDIVQRGAVWLTRLDRAIVEASECTPGAELYRIVADAVRLRRTTLGRIERELAATPWARRTGHAALRAVLAEPLTESDAEHELLQLLLSLGVAPAVQHAVHGPGRVWRIDFAYITARLAVELDSYLWHSSPADQQREIDKHNDLVRAGWDVIRVTPRDVRERPANVLGLVKTHLGL